MRKIATRLGVSQATAYRYFADKEEMLSVVRAAAVAIFVDALRAARGDLRSRAAARAVGRAYLEFALENPELYRLIFDVLQPEPGQYRELANATNEARKIMNDYVLEMAEEGLIHEDPGPLAVILWSGAHGLIMNYLSGLIEDRMDLLDLHEKMMRRLLLPVSPA